MGPDYVVRVEPFNNLWQIVWTKNNVPYPPYFVNAKEIGELADDIRAVLSALVVRSTKGALFNGRRSEVVPVLRELMVQGHRLYGMFFHEESDTSQTPTRIQAALARRTDRAQICFKVKTGVHVPWALMSEAPAPSDPDDGSVARYRSFWALKYSIATVYDSLLGPDDFEEPAYPAADFDTLIGVDTTFHAKASAQLDPAAPERALFSLLQSRYDVPITNAQALLAEWKRRQARLGLLYLYCHSSDKRIGFATGDPLDTIDFKLQYNKPTVTPRCLVFLNGCHTAAGGFLEATGRPGFCGFIGAETVLPYMFAHRFGAAVIAGLYAGEPLVSIMDRLREQHWPLSLVYGLYAYPFLQLVPVFDTPRLSDHNYSDLAVGDETM